MRGRSSLTEHQCEQFVLLFETGIRSQAAANRLRVSPDVTRALAHRWRLHGGLYLVEYPSKRTYPFAVKKKIVDRFLAGETMMELAATFQLSFDQIVKRWVREWRQL